MAVSDNNRKKPARTKATSAGEWRRSTTTQLPLVMTPTGKWIRFRRPGMTKFLEAGFLPDTLAGLVRKEIASASKKPGAKSVNDKELLSKLTADLDEAGMLDMLAALDRIIVTVMVEPRVVWHRVVKRDEDGVAVLDDRGREILEDVPDDDRSNDVVYTDEIEQEDKNFIFQAAVGGSTDLARFRAQSAAVMDSLSSGQIMEEAPERAPAPESRR